MTAATGIRELIAAGFTMEQAMEAADIMERHLREIAPQETPEERRRRISRETSARHRASRNVTSVSPDQRSIGDAKRHQTSPGDAKTSRLARVDNNPLSLDNTGNHTTLNSACAWPETDRPSRSELDALEAACREAAGPALHTPAGALMNLAPLLRLARAGKGPPCDLEADVLATLRAKATKTAPGSVKSWDFYTAAICEARDRRLSGAPAMGEVIPLRGSGQASIVDRIASENAEARRKAFALMDAQDGR